MIYYPERRNYVFDYRGRIGRGVCMRCNLMRMVRGSPSRYQLLSHGGTIRVIFSESGGVFAFDVLVSIGE